MQICLGRGRDIDIRLSTFNFQVFNYLTFVFWMSKNEWQGADMPGEREGYPGIRAATGMRDKGGDTSSTSVGSNHNITPTHQNHLLVLALLLLHITT